MASGGTSRLRYLDWLRGLAVVAMVLAHVIDSWTREADRRSDLYFTLFFIVGVASPLFLFLAGLATALSASSKGRAAGDPGAGARTVRQRGWEIFALGLLFRLQAQLLGWGPITNLFKVDILNTMGLSIVGASWLWQFSQDRRLRLALFALGTTVVTMATPLVRAVAWLSVLPDPLEAYLRPASSYAAFPLFPWAGFLFAGVIVGDLVDGVRDSPRRQVAVQAGLAAVATLGVWLAWLASLQPPLFPTARFWHDSPTFFFVRLGLATLVVPVAWLIAMMRVPGQQPLVTLGRSSLFVYWIHVEMVYGVVAEPLKRTLPLWGSLIGTTVMVLWLYALVLVKNRLLGRYTLRGPFRLLAPVVR